MPEGGSGVKAPTGLPVPRLVYDPRCMRISRLKLENWMNFRSVDLPLDRRVFVVGPNASGKSNLLDSIRFLRDVADPEGGFQRAVRERGGISQIRSLHARRQPNVVIEVELEGNAHWAYRLEMGQDNLRRAQIKSELVRKNGVAFRRRPDDNDRADPSRLSQTHLEQVSANHDFREVAEELGEIRYLHIVPQLVRDPDRAVRRSHDPYGSDFLEQIARTPKKTLTARLRSINEALRVAVPQLRELKLEPDERGVPHLRGLYEHWRPNAGWQNERQFSDGTLRLIGLLWAFLEGSAPLLLEEPELSLHAAVVRHVPAMMITAGRKVGRQVIVSTHSADLLSDPGIAAEEVILLEPTAEGTSAQLAASNRQVKALLESGMPMGLVVLPVTSPPSAMQLSLFSA